MVVASRLVAFLAAFSAGLPTSPAQAQTDTAAVLDSLVEAVVYTTARPPNYDVYLFEEPGGSPRRLTDDPALDYNAVFSPDGRWVVFTSERAGGVDLYALDLEAGSAPARLTYHRAMEDAATFSPDGERLAFVSTRDGYADIFVMPFLPGDTTAESRALNLTHRPGGDFNPAFSPDGRQIAFSRQEHLWPSPDPDDIWAIELYVMDADGSNARRISRPWRGQQGGGQVSGSPAWSRDGRAVYYYRSRERYGQGPPPLALEIRRIAPDGSDDVRIVPNGLSPAVRPDGRIAFVRPPPTRGFDLNPRSGQIVSVATDGSDVRTESEGVEGCFAPDFDRGAGRMVCHGPAPGVGSDPRGRYGAAFAPPGADREVELPDRTLEVRGIRGIFPALTASGHVLWTRGIATSQAVRAGRPETTTEPLHLSGIDGSGRRELFTPPSGIAWGAAVARDADLAVFAVGTTFGPADARVDIWSVRLDGSEAVNLTPDSPANDALPHVSSDGSRIAFRSSRVEVGEPAWRAGRTAVYVMDGDGHNVRRVTNITARETMPALSPDGDWVVFPTDMGRIQANGSPSVRKLWLQRVDGSEGRLLEPERSDIPDLSMHPRFSPDGEWVVFTSNRGGFNDEWLLTFEPQPYGELYAVPVSGGPAIRLTHDKWEDGPNDWGYARLPARQP